VKALVCLLVLEFVVVGAASSVEPVFTVSSGGSPPLIQPGRDACWSELPDSIGNTGSSEIIGWAELETEIANDFVFDRNERIVRARWWGGYW
jgi:hypothetical protein